MQQERVGQKEGKEEKEEKEEKDVPKGVAQRRMATNTQRQLFYRMTGLRAPFKRMTGIIIPRIPPKSPGSFLS